MKNLVLGTANFASDYGLLHETGPDETAIEQIIGTFFDAGQTLIDTAPAYGASEKIIGQFAPNTANYISKVPSIPLDQEPTLFISQLCEKTLSNLAARSLYGLLLHDPLQLLRPNAQAVADALTEIKSQGIATKIGVSVYNFEQMKLALRYMKPDIVQAPVNLLDRTFCSPEISALAVDQGIEFHARSIYLQGVLLKKLNELPIFFSEWQEQWDAIHRWAKDYFDNDIPRACFEIVRRFPHIFGTVIGVRSEQELSRTLAYLQEADSDLPLPPSEVHDERIINPTFWQRPI
jgi:aryl-alcohol dehydrogenase-like predicted oxidoreductase